MNTSGMVFLALVIFVLYLAATGRLLQIAQVILGQSGTGSGGSGSSGGGPYILTIPPLGPIVISPNNT